MGALRYGDCLRDGGTGMCGGWGGSLREFLRGTGTEAFKFMLAVEHAHRPFTVLINRIRHNSKQFREMSRSVSSHLRPVPYYNP